jgi:hypothetical protein
MATTGGRDNGPLSGLPWRGSCRAPGAAAGTSLPWLHASSGGEYWHTGETERPGLVAEDSVHDLGIAGSI